MGEDGEPAVDRAERANQPAEPVGRRPRRHLEHAVGDDPDRIDDAVGQLAQLASGGGRYPVDLTLSAADTTASLQGALDQTAPDLRPDLEVTVEGRRLADLNPLVGAKLPDAGPFRLTTRVRGEAKGYVLSGLQAKLGESDLSGEATLKMTGDRPALSGAFTSARIDLPQLLGAGDGDGDGGGDDAGRLFPDTPLPLQLLRTVDADLKLDVGALRLAQGATANEVTLALSLADGALRVQPLQGQFAGGRLSADLSVDSTASPAQVALKVDADAVDYGRVLRDLGITNRAEGTLGARADVSGAGASPHAVAASLRGRIEVIGGEGRFAHDLLENASVGLRDVLAPWTQDDASGMRLNCVVGRFQVADGVADSQAILADTADVTLVGDGSIDLGTERYDLQLVPKAKRASLASLAVPVRVTGPLTRPEVGPDPVGAAKAGAIAIGSLVNPLATLGALVLESETQDENPCVRALREATRKDEDGAGQAGGGSNGLGGFLEGLGDSIDKQLGVEGQ